MIIKLIFQLKTTLQKASKNLWSVFSFTYIFIWFFLAIFAYFIIPDKTKHANHGDLNLASKPPGFKITTFELQASKRSFTDFWLGQTEIPETYAIKDYSIKQDTLFLALYQNNKNFTNYKVIPLSNLNVSNKQDLSNHFKTKKFLLGTDKAGRDYFSRIVLGARISLSIGLVAVLISLIVGILIGTLGGYFGGKIDAFVMWLINVVWSVPTLLMVIAITLSLGKGYWQVFLAVGLTMWVEVARIVRGQILGIKELPYITAAKALGFSHVRIIIKHIFPNITGPIIVIATANFASAILVESGLSFLGLGAQPPVPSWGSMIKDYYGDMILGKPYLAIIPGLAIMTTVLAFMMLGNGLRDYFNQAKK